MSKNELKKASLFLFSPGFLYKDNSDWEMPEIQKNDKALAIKISDSYIPIWDVDR
jgi:hypothetical protein